MYIVRWALDHSCSTNVLETIALGRGQRADSLRDIFCEYMLFITGTDLAAFSGAYFSKVLTVLLARSFFMSCSLRVLSERLMVAIHDLRQHADLPDMTESSIALKNE